MPSHCICHCRPDEGLISEIVPITQFQVILKSKYLGKLLTQLAEAGVNIEASYIDQNCYTDLKFGTFQKDLAISVLESFPVKSFQFDTALFYTFGISDMPGLLAQVVKALECAHIGILQIYLSISVSEGNKVLLNTDNNRLAYKLLRPKTSE